MVTVSLAANLRGSAGSAASLAASNFAPSVIPSEARNLLFAASPPEPSHATAPIPLAACRINSLRFMTPPLFSAAQSRYRVWTPRSSVRYHCNIIGSAPVPRRTHHTLPANRLPGCVIRHHAFLSDQHHIFCLQGFTIEIPKHERRRHPRYRAPKDLLVGWQGAGKRNVSNAEELGVGGVFLLVAHPLSAGTHVEMLFDVPSGEVRARAIVRHGRAGHGMGVQFVHIGCDERARTHRFLKQLDEERSLA